MVKLVYPYAKFLSTFFYYIRITAQIKRKRDSVPYPIHYDQRDIILLNNNDTENCSNNTIIKMKRGKENINKSELKQKSSELHATCYRHFMTMTLPLRAILCHIDARTKTCTGQMHTVAGLSLIHGNVFVWISFMLQSLKPGRLDLK